ncbi:MAG: hypothetical protein J6S89_02535 [Paludibacteraceae bacterium]|nr:hypothetical protein [Paludibacteraceae bacterium]
MRYLQILILPFTLLLLSACDSGDIYPVDKSNFGGLTCKIALTFKHTSTWPSDYHVVLAAYQNDSEYSEISKGISRQVEGDTLHLTMTDIPESCQLVTIAIVNKSKRNVVNLMTHTIQASERNERFIELGTQNVDLLAYERVQAQVFSNCTNCHGGSARAAAGLFLTEGKSYDALVNVSSTKNPDKVLVSPGIPSNSFILDVLEGNAENVRYDHTNVSFNSETEDLNLLKEWIKNLDK